MRRNLSVLTGAGAVRCEHYLGCRIRSRQPACALDIPAKTASTHLRCGVRRRLSAIMPRMPHALDCHRCGGYRGIHAVIHDIGVSTPDITASRACWCFRNALRGHCFSWIFRIDRVSDLWQPLRYTPIWGLLVVIRDGRFREFLGHSFVRVRVPMVSAVQVAAAIQSERRVDLW